MTCSAVYYQDLQFKIGLKHEFAALIEWLVFAAGFQVIFYCFVFKNIYDSKFDSKNTKILIYSHLLLQIAFMYLQLSKFAIYFIFVAGVCGNTYYRG